MSNTQHGQHKGVFLATTALEEFWDPTKPMVFLGEWCLLYGRRTCWETLNGQLLKHPSDNLESARALCQYIDGVYERILPILGDALNTVHGSRHGPRYWRILLGPWLQLYLPVLYDRYSHISYALKQYPECTTIVLSESSYVTSLSTLDFAMLAKDDSFNLQIYTKLFVALGKSFPCKKARIKQSVLYEKLAGNSWKHKAAGCLSRLCAGIGSWLSQSVVLRSSYFSRATAFDLLLKTAGKVLPIIGQVTAPMVENDGDELRRKLPELSLGSDGFERCLSMMMISDMPRCFLEEYSTIRHDAIKSYPKCPKAIFSANAWYYDEHFKQWAAESAEKGALLIGTPHGGNYGGLANMPSENHETTIVDRYYSWGWDRKDCKAEVIPFPATKLVGRNKIGASNRKKGILWVGTISPRYLLQFPFSPGDFHGYLMWQLNFATSLSPQLISVVRFRPHREDGGWGVVERLNESVPSLKIETWDIPFQESLSGCRLYICDHFSTTFAEALAANKPTVLFWDPEANKLRPEAQQYYDLLRKAGILFDTPVSAANMVAQIYDDVESWWNAPERQSAVDIFCERFARNTPDAIEMWAAEFKKIAGMPESRVNRI